MHVRLAPLQLVLAVAAFALTSLAAARPPAAVETVDLMPLYWQFWDRAHALPVDQQVRLFREMVVDRRPEVYNASVMNVPGGSRSPRRCRRSTRRRRRGRRRTWTSSGRCRARSRRRCRSRRRRSGASSPTSRSRAVCTSCTHLARSTGRCGRSRAGTRCSSASMSAAIHGSGASVAPLFHHELFHAYHGPLIGDTGRGLPLYLSVWTEGLATLVARELNPSASDAAIFGLPPNTPQRTRADLPRLASLLRAKLDSTSPEDYDAFFIGNEPDAALPRRSGYYLGYLVAARIQQGRPLRDLARLKGPELRQAIADALAAPETLVEARRAVTARVWGDPRDRGAHAPHGMLGSVARRRPAPGPRFVHGLARTPDVECRHRVPRSVRTPLSVLRQWLTRRNSPLLRNGPLPRRADAFRFP